MTDDNLTRINRVAANGDDCPDGVSCPTHWQTSRGTRIITGYPVTDPEALKMLDLHDGEIAVEVPASLLDPP